jgi:hypothetical protein
MISASRRRLDEDEACGEDILMMLIEGDEKFWWGNRRLA